MGDIITSLKLGELMTESSLTLQASLIFIVIGFVGINVGLYVLAKAYKVYKDARK